MDQRAIQLASSAIGRLPDGVGQFRLASRLIGAGAVGPAVREVRMRNGTQMALDVHDRTQGIAFVTRRFDAELAAHIVRRLRPGGVFVDAGANVGLVSFAVARERPQARVYGFEPFPETAQMWERNRVLNGAEHATLVETALSDKTGTAYLGMDADTDSGSGRIDATSERTVTVRTQTLDEFAEEHGIDRIDVLKLDVQGHEPNVLRGCERLLAAKAIGTVVVEANDGDALDAVLHAAGYERHDIPPVGLRRLRRNPPMGDRSYSPAS